MDWLSDAWSGVRSFLGLGRKDDDERKRREQEEARRRQEAQRQQAQKQQQQAQVKTQPTPLAPQQQPWARSTADTLGLNRKPEAPKPQTPKPEAPKPQAVSPQDRKLIQGISGYHVMSPTAQKQALEKARAVKANTPTKKEATPKREAPKIADPMRDVFHQNPAKLATSTMEQRMAQTQAQTLNRQTGEAKAKAQTEAKMQADLDKELDEIVSLYGEARLRDGSTINSVLRDFNSSNAWGQESIRRDLERRAYRTITNGSQEIEADREQASVLLALIENRGDKKSSALQAGGNLLEHLVTDTADQVVNIGQGLRSAFGGGNELDELRKSFESGEISEQEYIERANDITMRISKMTGSLDGVDKGMTDRLLRSFGNAVDLAGVIPIVGAGARGISTATRGARIGSVIGRDVVENAAFGSLGSLRQGVDTTLNDAAIEAAISGVLGGVVSAGGAAAGGLINMTKPQREAIVRALEERGVLRADAEAAIDARIASEGTADGFTPEQLKRIEDAKAAVAERDKNRLPAGVDENNLPVVSVKRADGRLEMYQPRSIDEFNRYNEFIDGAHAGKADVNGDIWHISSGNRILTDGKYKPLDKAPEITVADPNSLEGIQRMLAQADEARETIPQVQEQAAQQAQGGRRGGISAEEIMERYRERSRIYNEADPATRAEINERAASQVNPDDVTMDSPWSREAVWSDLLSAIEEADARRLTQMYRMSAQDWRAVLNATGDLGNARNKAAVLNSQIKKVLGREPIRGGQASSPAPARNVELSPQEKRAVVDSYNYLLDEYDFVSRPQLRQDLVEQYGISPERVDAVIDSIVPEGALRQAATPVNEPSLQETPQAGRYVETPEGTVDTLTGEYVEPNARGAEAPRPEEPAGNPFQAEMNEREAYIRRFMDTADEMLKEGGSSYQQLHSKIQTADRSGVAPNLTEVELSVYREIRAELDSVLDELIEAGVVSPNVGRREWYLPQQKAGEVSIPKTIEEMYSTGFGYDRARSNAIDIGELDDTFDPVIDYYVKGTPQAQKSLIYDDIIAENPNITPEAATKMAESKYTRIKETNTISRDPKADPRKIDSIKRLHEEGDAAAVQRVIDDSHPGLFDINSRDRLKAIQSDTRGKSLYDSGFGSYRFATAVAQDITDYQSFMQVARANGINNLSDSKLARIAGRSNDWVANLERRLSAGEIDEAAFAAGKQEAYAQGIRLASKANLEDVLMRVEYSNPRVRELVNYEFNSMNIGYNKAQSLINDMGKITRRIWNNSMRNLNVNSFMNEMTDLINVVDRFGVNKESLRSLNPADMYDTVRRYGVGHTLNRMDNPDVAVEAMSILHSGDRKAIDKLFQAADTIDRKTALYSVAENYKAASYLKAAENFHASRGLSGAELRQAVLNDFDKDMIPLDHFSRVFSTDNQGVKLMTQYLDWNILHTMQQGRRLVGSEASAAGRYADMGRMSRIANNVATNLTPRVAIGMVRGAPILTTIGVLDPLGLASQDYSGIQDKTALDEVISLMGVSPVLGLASQFYLNYRQDEIANENYDGNPPEDNRGDWLERSLGGVGKMFTPFGGQLHRTGGMVDVLNKGYSENKSGRVQYLAPENPFDIARGLVMGKGQTQPAREYSGTPDLFSMMVGDATLGDLLTSNPSFEALQTFLGQENVGDYKRPVSDNDFVAGMDEAGNAMTKNFNDLIKNAGSRQEQEAILKQARDYNEVLDNFRRENPRAAEAYDQVMSNDDLVSPEYWREIIGTAADGSINLDIFKMIGDRKKELAKSLDIPYDPMYDLPDDQARSLLQLKSTATGDDLALRNILYKTEWYNKYVDDRNAYYDQMPENLTGEGRRETERVKTWNAYNESLTELSLFRSPETQRQFPYHAAYKAAESEFEDKTGKEFYGSPERDAWMATYSDGYYGEKDSLNAAKLELINQMRVIENFPPMSLEEYEQATNIANTSGGGGRSGGGGGWDRNDFIGRFENNYYASTAPKAKPRNIQFKPNTSAGSRNRATANLGARSVGRDSGGYSL